MVILGVSMAVLPIYAFKVFKMVIIFPKYSKI